jgi:hypothetical protein
LGSTCAWVTVSRPTVAADTQTTTQTKSEGTKRALRMSDLSGITELAIGD